jgi:hypothetical protein
MEWSSEWPTEGGFYWRLSSGYLYVDNFEYRRRGVWTFDFEEDCATPAMGRRLGWKFYGPIEPPPFPMIPSPS